MSEITIETVVKRARKVYAFLREKKAFRYIIGFFVVINMLLPAEQTQLITWTAIICCAFLYVSSILPESFYTLKEAEKIMQPKEPAVVVTPTESKTPETAPDVVKLAKAHISYLLEDDVGTVEWSFGDEFSEAEYCAKLANGEETRVFFDDGEFDAADIKFYPTPVIEFINYTHLWFLDEGKSAIAELVFAANSVGKKGLLLNSVNVPDFPDETRWPLLNDYLVAEGYVSTINADGIEIGWQRKTVRKKNIGNEEDVA